MVLRFPCLMQSTDHFINISYFKQENGSGESQAKCLCSSTRKQFMSHSTQTQPPMPVISSSIAFSCTAINQQHWSRKQLVNLHCSLLWLKSPNLVIPVAPVELLELGPTYLWPQVDLLASDMIFIWLFCQDWDSNPMYGATSNFGSLSAKIIL